MNTYFLNKQNKRHCKLFANSFWLFDRNNVSSDGYEMMLNNKQAHLNKIISKMAPRNHKRQRDKMRRELRDIGPDIIEEMLDLISDLDEFD
jgi:hypothetical protein